MVHRIFDPGVHPISRVRVLYILSHKSKSGVLGNYIENFLLLYFKNLDVIGFEVLEIGISNLRRSNQYLDNIKFGRADSVLKFLQIRIFSLVPFDRHHRFHPYFDLKISCKKSISSKM